MNSTGEKVKKAVKFLRFYCQEFDWSDRFLPGLAPSFVPQLCFSGGKDSILTKFLCDSAGIKYNPVYSVTTIDPPPLVKFIKQHHPDVIFHPARKNFFHRLVEIGFPIRQYRWCCKEYKENTGTTFLSIIGVRAEESSARAKRWSQLTRHRADMDKYFLCPSLDFSSKEVWDIIISEGLKYCELYDQGFKRLGCIACPMATARERKQQLAMFPGFEKLYRLAFSRLWTRRCGTTNKRNGLEWFGSRKFTCSDDLFVWWIDGISSPDDLIKSGFDIDDVETDNDCESLFDFNDSCDLGMF